MYSQRNQLCSYQGNAYTNNAKFLSPNNPIYLKQFTNMILYPGNTGFLPPQIPYPCNLGPESIKAWEKHNCNDPHHIPPHLTIKPYTPNFQNPNQHTKAKTPSQRSCRTCGL